MVQNTNLESSVKKMPMIQQMLIFKYNQYASFLKRIASLYNISTTFFKKIKQLL